MINTRLSLCAKIVAKLVEIKDFPTSGAGPEIVIRLFRAELRAK
jgi:hypothetical protein